MAVPGYGWALGVLMVVAGCAAPDEGPARLEILHFGYDDKACSDVVPFRFDLANGSPVTAWNITIRVDAGDRTNRSFDELIHAVAAQDTRHVEGVVTMYDRCFLNDVYDVVASADPENGPRTIAKLRVVI